MTDEREGEFKSLPLFRSKYRNIISKSESSSYPSILYTGYLNITFYFLYCVVLIQAKNGETCDNNVCGMSTEVNRVHNYAEGEFVEELQYVIDL